MSNCYNVTIEKHNNFYVLRDDLLLGGTKSRFIEKLLNKEKDGYVYASPVYGGFQIALAGVCKKINKQAVIFCAKRKEPHTNSLKVKKLGGLVYQVPYGYLSNVQKKAKDFIANNRNYQILKFGANYQVAIDEIALTMQAVTRKLKFEPENIWCAYGSGTLTKGIIKGTQKSIVKAVQVGKECDFKHPRLQIYKYPKPFDYLSKYKKSFDSCENYDLKAWEMCNKIEKNRNATLFWNVL